MKMMKPISLFFLFLFSILSFDAFADSRIITGDAASQEIRNTELIRYNDRSSLPNFIKFQSDKKIAEMQFNAWINQFFKTTDVKFVYQNSTVDELGWKHTLYQQMIYGYPVEFGLVSTHIKDHLIHSISGELYPLNISGQGVGLTEEEALSKAKGYIGAQLYKWEQEGEEEHLKREQEDPTATYFPKGELVYILRNNNPKERLHLAYKFNIYAAEPLSRRNIWIDAKTGEILYENSLICEANANGTAHTQYSGVQTIVTDRVTNNNFRLRETGRAGGTSIRTYNLRKGTNYSNAQDFTDTDNIWNNVNGNKDQYATDAHWGHEMTVDYYWQRHNRNSIDGSGMAVLGYLHYSNNYVNAFWDGFRMTYGDGNSTYNPLVNIDVCGHELTHGVTERSANLQYAGESGALNESFSDIFGNSVEKFARPTGFDWRIGEGMGGAAFRNMANPKQYGQPNTYQGTYWASTANPAEGNDWGGVHTNSGVQNYWFYLLVEGGNGVNDKNSSYSVIGIDWTDAEKIAYRALITPGYIMANSNYADSRFYTIQAADDLFGPCSQQLISTTDAWYAVGVGGAYSGSAVSSQFTADITSWCESPLTVNFTNMSSAGPGINYNWNFGDGSTSTQQNPSHTYTSNGFYTVSLTTSSATCGSDVETKPSYIEIDPSKDCFNCDTLNLPPPGSLTIYGTQQGGYITGKNGYNDKSFANKFESFTPLTHLTSVYIYFYYLKDGGNNAQVEINVWDNTGAAGAPGNIIAQQVYPLAALVSALPSGNGVLQFNFNDPVLVPSSYYVGVTLVGFGNGDDLAIVSNSDGDSNKDMTWIQESNNSWGSFSSQWGGNSLSLFVAPIMTATPPTAVATANTLNICEGDSIKFNASNSIDADNFMWYFEGGNKSTSAEEEIYVTFDHAGTYNSTLLAIGGCGARSTDELQIVVNPKPNISITASATEICIGESVSLSGNGASSYSWDNGLGNGRNKTVKPTSTTTYEVTGTANGCTATETVEIEVNPLPTIVITPSATQVCSGDQVTLTASGASSYSWSNGLGNGATKVINPTSTTTYTVTGNDGKCSASETIEIEVVSSPEVSISASSLEICAGDQVTLTASGASSYSWDNGLGNGATKIVAPTTTTTYQVTGSMGSCSDVKTVEIVVSPAIDIHLSASKTFICEGESVTLTASGASTYSWNNGLGSGSTKTVTPSVTTTYQVTGTSGSCNDVESIEIVVTPAIDVSISASSTVICAGDHVTLTASGASGYLWNNGLGSGTTKGVSPTTTTTYQVTGTSGNCSDIETIEIVVTPSIDVNISASTTSICAGDQVTLTASGASNYSWDNGLGNGSTKTVAPSVTTTYQVTGTSGSCSAMETIEIVVVPAIDVNISASSTNICAGDQVTLTASGASNYFWDNGLGNGAIKTITPTSTTTYQVMGTSGSCNDVETIEIIVNPAVDLDLSASFTEICEGESVTLTASGANTYTWDNGLGSGATKVVSPAATTTYKVTGTSNGCSDTKTIEIQVNPSPDVTITASLEEICAGDQVTLTASGANSYSWDNGLGNGSNKTVMPTTTTTYEVTGTVGSCTDVQTIEIVVASAIDVSITASTQEVCLGGQVTLTANGASNYSWDNGLGTGDTKTVFPTETTTYEVIGTSGSCSDMETIEIVVVPNISVDLTASTTEICAGDQVTLTASGASNYSWNNGLGNGAIQIVSPTETTTYQVTGTSGTCSDVKTIEIVVTSEIDITLTATSTNICAGDQVILTAGGASSYSWNESLGSGDIKVVAPTTTTTYQVNGVVGTCSGTEEITIQVETTPIVNAFVSEEVICVGDSVTLTASGASDYSWTPITGLNQENGDEVIAKPISSTDYTVIGTNDCGFDYTTVRVTVYPYPNTPVINQFGDVLSVNLQNGESAVWFLNGLSIGVGESIQINQEGDYTVVITNEGDCSSSAEGHFDVNTTGLSINEIATDLKVYPNPTGGELNIEWTNYEVAINDIIVLDALGRIVKSYNQFTNSDKITIDLSAFETGVYVLQLNTEKGIINQKVTKR